MAPLTDEELVSRVKRGETQWFAFIVDRYEEKLLRYAKKFLLSPADAEELVQDVFTKAFANIQSFDEKRSFSPWVYRIAHNEFVNALKRRKETIYSLDLDTILPYGGEAEAAAAGEASETKRLLDQALGKIDAKYREPLVLFYYEGLDYQAISDVMRIPVSTVGVRLKRGREALKKSLHQHDRP